MALTDPLQPVVITIVAAVLIIGIGYLLFRILRRPNQAGANQQKPETQLAIAGSYRMAVSRNGTRAEPDPDIHFLQFLSIIVQFLIDYLEFEVFINGAAIRRA